MTSDLCLYFAGIFLSFLLQITVAYIACSLLNRLLGRPGQRFAVWMTFLAASGAYWVALAGWNARVFAGAGLDPGVEANGVSPIVVPFLVPLAWSRMILVTSEVLTASYIAIVLILTMTSLWRHLRLRLMLRHGRPASNALIAMFETACRDLGIPRCYLIVMPGITSPATVGWLRPRILLPAVCEEMGATPRLTHALDHELAHVVRRDYLWAGLSELFCHLLFFHPAAWRAKRLMALERELACDCAVIESRPDHRADYADSLAYFVRLRMLEERTGIGLDFAASASSLGKRVRFILAGPPSLPWWKRASRAVAGLSVMAAFAVVGPVLTVFLAFARPLPAAGTANTQTFTGRPMAHRKARTNANASAAAQEISRIQSRSSVHETSFTSFSSRTAGSGSGPAGELNRPWQELDPTVNHPTVASVVRDAVSILRTPGSDHDHPREHNPRLTH